MQVGSGCFLPSCKMLDFPIQICTFGSSTNLFLDPWTICFGKNYTQHKGNLDGTVDKTHHIRRIKPKELYIPAMFRHFVDVLLRFSHVLFDGYNPF